MNLDTWREILECIRAEAETLARATPSDPYRSRSLFRAYRILSRLAQPPAKVEDLDAIPGIGKGTVERIRKYQTTQCATGVSGAAREQDESGLADVYGLGPARRAALAAGGIRTRAELIRAVESGRITLPEATLATLRHADDLAERIPREETRRFEAAFRTAVRGVAPGLRWEMAGSYRRGLPTQGDWDVLLSHARPERAFEAVLHRLGTAVELVELGKGDVKWEGLARLPGGKMRRLDLRMLPPEGYGAALLYFTGSKEHNLRLRQRAKRRNMKLNEYGLWSLADGSRVAGATEEDIFRALELPFVPPVARGG